jgi:alpha-beta hydrolase superfamily lysophospholipase
MTIRAIYRAIAIPNCPAPYDRASLKVFYPAQFSNSEEERNSGVVPIDSDQAPFPVVIMMPGINVGPEAYTWLARELAQQGIVTVTYTLVAEEMSGYISLTPGLSIAALAPERYGQTPSATAVMPILEELRGINSSGVLAGALDLDKVILGGHSAGGTVALLNARPDWFPGVCAAFSYGAHLGAATALGYSPDALFRAPAELPLLIMGGTRDGCIANSSGRYGDDAASATRRVEQTFDEALDCQRGDCYLAIIDGANHFSLAHPADDSTGRPFIDMATTQPDGALRKLLSGLICRFCLAMGRSDSQAQQELASILQGEDPLITRGAIR